MKQAWVLVAVLAAGCEQVDAQRNVNAMLEAHRADGNVVLTCRESSTGTCYALFSTNGVTVRAEAKVGDTSAASGIGEDTQYCIDAVDPQGGCKLSPLRDGEQIARMQTSRTH